MRKDVYVCVFSLALSSYLMVEQCRESRIVKLVIGRRQEQYLLVDQLKVELIDALWRLDALPARTNVVDVLCRLQRTILSREREREKRKGMREEETPLVAVPLCLCLFLCAHCVCCVCLCVFFPLFMFAVRYLIVVGGGDDLADTPRIPIWQLGLSHTKKEMTSALASRALSRLSLPLSLCLPV